MDDYTATLVALFAIMATLWLVFLIISIVWYVFEALGLYTMAKRRDIEHAWFGWVPILQNYLFGELIDDKVWGFSGAKWILTFGPVFLGFFTEILQNTTSIFVSLLITALALAYYVYMETAFYKLFKVYSKKAVTMLVLSIIFPFLGPVFIFAIRNNPEDLATLD